MSSVRSRLGTLLVAGVLTTVTMLVVQQLFLVIAFIAAVPGAVVAGLFAAWSRPTDDLRARTRTAAGAAVIAVVVLALWMLGSSPASHAVRIVLGWAVVAIWLTVLHSAVTAVASSIRHRMRGGQAALPWSA